MNNEWEKDTVYSGSLKRFEKRKSRHAWTERWAVLGSCSLRLFTNHESFLNATEEPKLIKLTADTLCESVNKKGQTFQFKIYNGETFVFRCESESSRQEWLSKLGMLLSGLCRNCCFHCSKEYDPRISIISDSGYSDRSSQSSTDGSFSQPGDIIQSTLNSSCVNISRRSTGYGDQITVKSPLKVYDTDQKVYSPFNKTENQTDSIGVNVDNTRSSKRVSYFGQEMKDEKSLKNSSGHSFEIDATDNATTSSLKLFDNQRKRFSTFSKRSSFGRNHSMTDFVNPNFEPENESFATEFPEIPKRISKVYDAPLDYDVPALSKNDPKRGPLKVLIGKNNWKKYHAAVEKNILILSDTEGSPEQNGMRIELKPLIKFTLLPRRNHNYRFKMTTGSSEYFLKTLNALQRDSWIKVLTEATRTVCQMACLRCCTNANENVPSRTERNTSQSNTSDGAAEQLDEDAADDVFYVGMDKPDEGITFMNLCPQETENALHDGAPEETNIELSQNESQNPSSFRSGYLKTNAIDNDWGRYWITIMDKQLVLHSSEENLDSLKSIELSPNVQCKITKRSLYDFRFTLVASAVECYEFKCVSGHDRREWMTSLKKVSGGAEQGFNAGSRISEIVIKMKENESRLEKIQQQQQQERERQQQLQEQQKQQQQELLQEVYETIPAETNNQQSIPLAPQQIPAPTAPPQQQQHQQQQQQNTEESGELYELIPADKQEQELQFTFSLKQQHEQKNMENNQDIYELMPADINQQQQNTGDMQDIYDDFASGNTPQHTLVPPPPQQLPPLTPPQLRKQQEQQHTLPPPQLRKHQQQRESVGDCQEIYDDFAASESIQQQQHLLPPPAQQLPPLIPPQKRQQQQLQQQQQNTDEGDTELYELLPGDNCEQESQPNGPSEDELYEVVPTEKIEQQQKSKGKKNKRILPHLHMKMLKKKEKKQDPDLAEKQAQELDAKEQEEPHQQLSEDNEELSECKEKESISKESTESNDKPLWNFEKHIQTIAEAMQGESLSSTEDKEVEVRESKAEAGSDSCVGGEKKPEAICFGHEKTVPETLNMTHDVERFLTQVLGKLSNLPDNVNKERLELSQRLQKFLNLPEKGVGKKKPPPPIPTEPVANKVDEDDEGEYGDVVSVVPTQDDGQETYDDVATGTTADPEEMYDDVSSAQTTAETPDADELYDDVNPLGNDKQRSLSRKSNSSDTLGAKDVIEPKKASDITDKVYEGYLEKYKGKGLFKKWQRRYCVLTPLALYYYENPKDQKQKGQIILPSSDSTLQKGSKTFPEVKEKKLCFELFNNDRTFLFKVAKESELDIWMKHITAALHTDLSDEQSRIMRQKSMKGDDDDVDDDVGEGEELYETIDTMQPKVASNTSNDSEPVVEEEMYELTDQFSQGADTSTSTAPAGGPALPSRNKTAAKEATPPPPVEEEEEFEKVDEDDTEDYQLPDANAPKPVSHQKQSLSGSPTLPPRPTSSQDAPHLPPRGATSTPGSQKPPELPSRSTSSTPKKAPPVIPTRTTPPLTKKPLSPAAGQPEPESPAPEVKPKSEAEVITPSPPVKPKAGEQFDYNRVYVAMWNCNADDEDDLAFSRGNYLYIREKIPNSDWWVASLMDIPEIRVGLVPRNFIMPAYDL